MKKLKKPVQTEIKIINRGEIQALETILFGIKIKGTDSHIPKQPSGTAKTMFLLSLRQHLKDS